MSDTTLNILNDFVKNDLVLLPAIKMSEWKKLDKEEREHTLILVKEPKVKSGNKSTGRTPIEYIEINAYPQRVFHKLDLTEQAKTRIMTKLEYQKWYYHKNKKALREKELLKKETNKEEYLKNRNEAVKKNLANKRKQKKDELAESLIKLNENIAKLSV